MIVANPNWERIIIVYECADGQFVLVAGCLLPSVLRNVIQLPLADEQGQARSSHVFVYKCCFAVQRTPLCGQTKCNTIRYSIISERSKQDHYFSPVLFRCDHKAVRDWFHANNMSQSWTRRTVCSCTIWRFFLYYMKKNYFRSWSSLFWVLFRWCLILNKSILSSLTPWLFVDLFDSTYFVH